MKYLSVLFFALSLAWTWNVIYSEAAISFETHAGIQEKVAQYIRDRVQAAKPQAQNIRITKVITSPRGPEDVKAEFSYSYQEPDESGKLVTSTLSGEGLLTKQPDDGSGLERWKLSDFHTSSNLLVFEEATLITPGEEPAPESPVITPSSENHQ